MSEDLVSECDDLELVSERAPGERFKCAICELLRCE